VAEYLRLWSGSTSGFIGQEESESAEETKEEMDPSHLSSGGYMSTYLRLWGKVTSSISVRS
jgi:hypothetical protein